MLFKSNRDRVTLATGCVVVIFLFFLFLLSNLAAPLNTVYLAHPQDLTKITHDLSKEDVRNLLGKPFARHDFDRGDGCWIYSHERNGLMRWESVRVCFDPSGHVSATESSIF